MTKIAQIRKEKGSSQRELAKRVGIHQSYLSQIETGKKRPSLKVGMRIAKELGVRLEELFEEEWSERGREDVGKAGKRNGDGKGRDLDQPRYNSQDLVCGNAVDGLDQRDNGFRKCDTSFGRRTGKKILQKDS